MTLEDLKRHLKSRLESSIADTIQQLRQIVENDEELEDELIVISGHYGDLLRRERTQLEAQDDIDRKVNNVRKGINDLIKKINTIPKLYDLSITRFDKILVICPNDERLKPMAALFPEKTWKNVKFDASGKLPSKRRLRDYEVVVFDNFTDPIIDQPSLLEKILKSSTKYILYYGPYSSLVTKYSTRIYSTNSIFSFHGRLQELLSYVRDFPEPEN